MVVVLDAQNFMAHLWPTRGPAPVWSWQLLGFFDYWPAGPWKPLSLNA